MTAGSMPMMAARWCSCSILDRVLAVDQLPGQLTLSASGPLDGDVRVKGLAAAGGFSAAVDGLLHLSGEQAPTGRLQIKASAADLRPLHRAMTGQPGTAVALTASSIVGFAGTDAVVHGSGCRRRKIVGARPARRQTGEPARHRAAISRPMTSDAAAVAAMMFGLLPSARSGAAWSPEPIGAGAFGALNGAVTFKLDRAALTPAWVARDLKGVMRFQPAQIALSDLDGSFAGGRLTGELPSATMREDFAARGRLELAGADAATSWTRQECPRRPYHGEASGRRHGTKPEALVGSVHGSGAMSLGDGSFAGIDPAAFDAAIRAADQSGAIELPKIRAAVSAAMDNGRLAVPKRRGRDDCRRANSPCQMT